MRAIGLDIGGSWLRGVRIDAPNEVSGYLSRPTPNDAQLLSDALGTMADELASGDDNVPTGLAVAPQLSPDGQVLKWGSRPEMVGEKILTKISARANPLSRMDDVTAAVWAEHNAIATDLSARSSTVLISIGTGLGGGAVVDGTLLRGASGCAMDLGHLKLASYTDFICGCGSRGCLQTVLSGAAFRLHGPYIAHHARGALQNLVELLEAMFDPDRIVMTGGAWREYGETYSLVDVISCSGARFENERLGPWSGAVGAAMLAFEEKSGWSGIGS